MERQWVCPGWCQRNDITLEWRAWMRKSFGKEESNLVGSESESIFIPRRKTGSSMMMSPFPITKCLFSWASKVYGRSRAAAIELITGGIAPEKKWRERQCRRCLCRGGCNSFNYLADGQKKKAGRKVIMKKKKQRRRWEVDEILPK